LKFNRYSEGKLIAIEKYHRVDLAVYEIGVEKYFAHSIIYIDTAIWNQNKPLQVRSVYGSTDEMVCTLSSDPAERDSNYGDIYNCSCSFKLQASDEKTVTGKRLWSTEYGFIVIANTNKNGKVVTEKGRVMTEINGKEVSMEDLNKWFKYIE
jgi:hypothetical protein